VQTDDPHARLFELTKGSRKTTDDAHRNVLDGSRCGFRRCRSDVDGSVARKDDTIDPCTVTRSKDCSQIARVRHTVDGHEERTSIFRRPTDKVGEIRFGDFCGKSDHTLRGFASRFSFQFATSDLAHRNSLVRSKVQDVRHYRVFVEVIRHDDLMHTSPTSQQQFPNGLSALDLRATESTIVG